MKTCKTGCGKMKAGGSVKKVKKMANGGQALNKAKGFAKPQTGGDNVKMDIFGISNKSGTTGPNRTGTYDYKKGGMVKKYEDGGSKRRPGSKMIQKKPVNIQQNPITEKNRLEANPSVAKKQIVTMRTGFVYPGKSGAPAPLKTSKKGGATTSRAVMESCKNGMVRGADGNCVMSRPKFKSGGSFGMLSVKAGVDKNPNPTAADRIAGAKMKKKIGGSVKK